MTGSNDREAFYRVAQSRRSVREFQEKDIPDDVLDRVLETGRRSASAANRQPWCFVVARKRDNHPLYGLLFGRGFQKAPVIVAGLADPGQAWVRKSDGANYAWVDVAIAMTEMILAATAEGLGSCWIAAFDTEAARRIIGFPGNIVPVSLVAMGYPVKPLAVESKDRKSRDTVIRWGAWKP